jgi:hypothetical protein
MEFAIGGEFPCERAAARWLIPMEFFGGAGSSSEIANRPTIPGSKYAADIRSPPQAALLGKGQAPLHPHAAMPHPGFRRGRLRASAPRSPAVDDRGVLKPPPSKNDSSLKPRRKPWRGVSVFGVGNPSALASPTPRLTGEGAAPISEIRPARPLRQVNASGPGN